jgi:1-deoxyxylulose-5-phosphate synthase
LLDLGQLSHDHIKLGVRHQVVKRARDRSAAPPAQLALAWLLHKSVVTAPIVGATKPHHLDDAVAAVDLKLSTEEIARLERPYVPHAAVSVG